MVMIYNEQEAMRKEAEALTEARLRARGMTDPMLSFPASLDDCEKYRAAFGTLYPQILAELSKSKNPTDKLEHNTKQTWADRAYS